MRRFTVGRRYRWSITGLVVIVAAVALLDRANGSTGAGAADLLRSTVGAERTAQVESWYLGAVDTWQRIQFHAGLTHVQVPWKVTPVPVAYSRPAVTTTTPSRRKSRIARLGPARHRQPVHTLSPLPRLHSWVSPLLSGEGAWTASVAPGSNRDPVPLIAKAFVRPDPQRPYAIATVLRFDLRYLALHIAAGYSEPGGPVGMHGTGTIPSSDRLPGMLLSAFNGGFKYADGAYGMMVNRIVYVNPIPNAATIAVTASGQVIMGAWGKDRRLSSTNRGLVSWRQNGLLLVDHGVVNPLASNESAWGTTVLNNAYTWRSAIGVTDRHTLLYVAGNALSVTTLARALKDAGARTAMELDINPYWVRAVFYGRDPARHLTMATLRPDMAGSGQNFLNGYSRDFFYLTRIPGRSRA